MKRFILVWVILWACLATNTFAQSKITKPENKQVVVKIPYVPKYTSFDSVMRVYTRQSMRDYYEQVMDKTFEFCRKNQVPLNSSFEENQMPVYFSFDQDLPRVMINGKDLVHDDFIQLLYDKNVKVKTAKWNKSGLFKSPRLVYLNKSFFWDFDQNIDYPVLEIWTK